eukprot:1329793-Rhodomonas_salina.4
MSCTCVAYQAWRPDERGVDAACNVRYRDTAHGGPCYAVYGAELRRVDRAVRSGGAKACWRTGQYAYPDAQPRIVLPYSNNIMRIVLAYRDTHKRIVIRKRVKGSPSACVDSYPGTGNFTTVPSA